MYTAGADALAPAPAVLVCCAGGRLCDVPAAEVCVGAALGLLTAPAVAFLKLAEQFIFVAGDLIPLVVGDLAPLLAGLAFELIPFAFDHVPVDSHRVPPCVRSSI
jgi:hypothetical protein